MIQHIKLSELCSMKSGGTPSRSKLEYYEGDFPWAKISDLEKSDDGYIYKTEEHITQEALESINNRQFKPETLLLAMYGSVGKTAITKINLTTNQAILGINILDENSLDIKYLKYWFSTIKEKLLNRAVGAALPNISLGIVKDLQIPLPPLPTQQKIASILDAADTLRQKDKALLAKYDELTQSLFLDMFGDVKINPFGFPKTILNHVCNKITDGEHGTVERKVNGKLYLMARNIRENYIDLSDVSFISDEDHQRIYKRCKAEKGDILLVCVGATIGRLCVMPEMEEFSLARSVALLKPKKEKVESHFLYSVLNTKYIQDVIKRSGNSSAQAGLYTGKIKEIEIYLPPIKLQNQFAEHVAIIEQQKAIAQASLEKSEQLFNSLLQKAFKGELV